MHPKKTEKYQFLSPLGERLFVATSIWGDAALASGRFEPRAVSQKSIPWQMQQIGLPS